MISTELDDGNVEMMDRVLGFGKTKAVP